MSISDEDIIDILPIFDEGILVTMDEIMSRGTWKISREDILEIIAVAIKKGYMDVINEGKNNRYCSTRLGRDFLAIWYQ